MQTKIKRLRKPCNFPKTFQIHFFSALKYVTIFFLLRTFQLDNSKTKKKEKIKETNCPYTDFWVDDFFSFSLYNSNLFLMI